MTAIFAKLGLPERPIMLAPLAGVSDHPFRRVCARAGAHLTYVEMLSATALTYESKKTFEMMKRHEDEQILGVQVTGKTADEVGRAVAILSAHDFQTIDINMGCPVTKVTKNGAGSGMLKEPERAYATVKAAINNTDKPLSVKMRIGWDHNTITCFEIAQAAQEAGAAWLTLHGRLRSDDYSDPVDLLKMAKLRHVLTIPYIGNGNIFTVADAEMMTQQTGVDGLMLSRGALGNPWLFRDLTSGVEPVLLEEWLAAVLDHLRWQEEEYGGQGRGAVCMRKHLLWYVKGWPGAKKVRERIVAAESIAGAQAIVTDFAEFLRKEGVTERACISAGEAETRYHYDPKYEMDRQLDRGVGHEGLADS